MDLQTKAFDTVSHCRLLYKLQWYGIQGKTHRWITNFLISRSQRVVLDRVQSFPISVSSGVPQGTVLGPLMFLIYINDLPDCIKHSTVRLFTDDCIIYKDILSSRDTHLLQMDINAITKWADTWLTKFNVSKCCCTQFTEAKIHCINSTYHLNNIPLSSSDHCKYLRVTLQSNLKWDKHIYEKTASANCTLRFLKRNIKTSARIRDLAYKALVRPKLECASTV